MSSTEVSLLSTRGSASSRISEPGQATSDFDWDFDVPSLEVAAESSPGARHQLASSFPGQHDSASTIYVEGLSSETRPSSASKFPTEPGAKQASGWNQSGTPTSAFQQSAVMDSASTIHVRQASASNLPLQHGLHGQGSAHDDVHEANELTMRSITQLSHEVPCHVAPKMIMTHDRSDADQTSGQSSWPRGTPSYGSLAALQDTAGPQSHSLTPSGSWNGFQPNSSSTLLLPPRPRAIALPQIREQQLQQSPEVQTSPQASSGFVLPFRPRTPNPLPRPAKPAPLQRLSVNHPSDGGPVVDNQEICIQMQARHAQQQILSPFAGSGSGSGSQAGLSVALPRATDAAVEHMYLSQRAGSLQGQAGHGMASQLDRAQSAPLNSWQPSQMESLATQQSSSTVTSMADSSHGSTGSFVLLLSKKSKSDLRRASSSRNLLSVGLVLRCICHDA